MDTEKTDYCSYMLRLWRDGATASWRASLEAPGRASTQMFTDLDALFSFLRSRTGGNRERAVAALEPQAVPPGQPDPHS
jgi:hypothetical protein